MKRSSLFGRWAPFAPVLLLFACNDPVQPEPIEFHSDTPSPTGPTGPTVTADPEACVTSGAFHDVRAYAFGSDGSAVIATGPAYGGTGAAAVHKVDASCKPVWTFTPAAGDTLWILRVGAEPNGEVVVAGGLSSTSEPDADLRSGGELLLMKLDAGGHQLWRASSHLGGRLSRILFAPAGDIVVSGRASDPATSDRWDLVARYDGGGRQLWQKPFGDARARVNDLTVNGAGEVLVAGMFSDPFDFGGGVLTPAHTADTLDTFDAFLVKLDAAGAHRWSERFGDEQSQSFDSVSVDASGNVSVLGRGNGTIDLGGGPLDLGENGTFGARFDAAGRWIWSGPATGAPPASP